MDGLCGALHKGIDDKIKHIEKEKLAQRI